MELKPAQQKVMSFLQNQQTKQSVDVIVEKTKLAKIVVINTLKQLQGMKLVTMEEKEGKKSYSAVTGSPVKETPAKQAEEKPIVPKNNQKPARDLSRYRFGGVEYNKSRYALEVCKHAFPKLNLAKLDEIFADLRMSYNLYAPLAKAKEVSVDRKRFFLDTVVQTKDGKKLHVSNQFTQPLIESFIKICNKAGIKTK